MMNFTHMVDAYLKRTETSPTAFGKNLLGDPSYVKRLREGRSPTLKVVEKTLRVIGEDTVKIIKEKESDVGHG